MLLLVHFNFQLTYRPGSRNLKADALSRKFMADQHTTTDPETIIPSSCDVAAVSWEIESLVKEAQGAFPDTGGGPGNFLFVPDPVRSQLLQCVHTSRLACHQSNIIPSEEAILVAVHGLGHTRLCPGLHGVCVQ